ncbi:bifunctional riboflavin kinase/FAD synthetase [Planococcus lenghuensis]|uniref:Riboflavin biosynthesis protein n=1 Tax=Planococcus lenghuensis TaxID=2213202 RepID=A0A1Q2KZW9_9BACL|nr:bifunctional riboflavin kinase/FAD synthetase [Planococcus lenghuensis]AQQ53713.1 riboflavin biosynthesis protein RibF [Planococcus lenghuensis]
MEVIQLSYPNHHRPEQDIGPLSLALGFFDGVHIGHQRVIGEAIRKAEELNIRSAVMTFDPHPSVVLSGKRTDVCYITPLQQKLEVLDSLGVDVCLVVRFTSEFAQLTPEQFIRFFIKDLQVRHVTAGFDFSFGKRGEGKMADMERFSDHAFGVSVVTKQEADGEKISSTRIRELLRRGEVNEVRQLMGRPFRTKGIVVHGDKRGRTIGFPTANIRPADESFLPGTGVFAVRIFVQDKAYDGVCNVGYKPTFENPDDKKLSIEVHIPGFDKSIYGEEVAVDWYRRIRDEQKFSGIDELKMQIARDKEEAIRYFKG